MLVTRQGSLLGDVHIIVLAFVLWPSHNHRLQHNLTCLAAFRRTTWAAAYLSSPLCFTPEYLAELHCTR